LLAKEAHALEHLVGARCGALEPEAQLCDFLLQLRAILAADGRGAIGAFEFLQPPLGCQSATPERGKNLSDTPDPVLEFQKCGYLRTFAA
jgi:hypothetical protein